MSGQWEKYVEKVAAEIRENVWQTRSYWVDENGCEVEQDSPEAVQIERMTYIDPKVAARAALTVVGPLIAEDTRDRLVAAAARAVERGPQPSLFYCPAGDEIEQQPGGGFDVCCDSVDRHQPITPQALAAARRDAAQEIAIHIKTFRLQFDPESPAATELFVAEEIARDFAAEQATS